VKGKVFSFFSTMQEKRDREKQQNISEVGLKPSIIIPDIRLEQLGQREISKGGSQSSLYRLVALDGY